MTKRQRILEQIRALRAKTVANGCTEAEALAAAAKVAELMARYNIDLDEVELRTSPFARHTERHDDAVGERLWMVADGVEKLTDTRYWTSKPGVHPVVIGFFGLEHEVEVAAYLMEVCAGAMRREERRLRAEWALLTATRQRAKIMPFLDGMADRLRARLFAMKPPAPTGRGLVVLKDSLIDAGMAAAGLEIKERAARSSRDFEASFFDGRRAADAVALNRGLRGHANPSRLGGRNG